MENSVGLIISETTDEGQSEFDEEEEVEQLLTGNDEIQDEHDPDEQMASSQDFEFDSPTRLSTASPVATPVSSKVKPDHSVFKKMFVNGRCIRCSFVGKLDPKGRYKACNAKRHFERIHPAEHDALLKWGDKSALKVLDNSSSIRLLSLFTATTSMPLHLLRDKYFKSLLSKIPGFEMPCGRSLLTAMDTELDSVCMKIRRMLGSDALISLSTDIATTKGMRLSYLGVVLHSWRQKSIALDIKELHNRQNADNISSTMADILKDFNVSGRKVFRFVTDSASNMKAAFINPFLPWDELDETTGSGIGMDQVDEEEFDRIFGMYDENTDSPGLSETEHDFAVRKSNQFSCVAHRLQLVLKDVFEKDEEMINLRKRIFKVIAKFSKSHAATKALYIQTGRKLLFPANTRWSSLQITYKRLLEVFDAVNGICDLDEFRWDTISEHDKNLITHVVDIVDPFRKFTDVLQQDVQPTLSRLYPGLIELRSKIQNVNQHLPEICQNLITSLDRRFADIFASGHSEDADPIFLAAAFFDPIVAPKLCNPELGMRARVAIKNLMTTYSYALTTTNGTTSSQLPTSQSTCSIFGFDTADGASTVVTEKTFEEELDSFIRFRYGRTFQNMDAFNFWDTHNKVFPRISIIAKAILSCPATSASVERLFSQLTLNTCSHKASTTSRTIRRKVLLHFNEHLI